MERFKIPVGKTIEEYAFVDALGCECGGRFIVVRQVTCEIEKTDELTIVCPQCGKESKVLFDISLFDKSIRTLV